MVGLNTRYSGKLKRNPSCSAALKDGGETLRWIPVCPEQLGGLPTPRDAADIVGGTGDDVLDGNARVITKNGIDVTEHFIRGAEQVLQIARMTGAKEAWLKARSPSCAVQGSVGVAAALLARNGIRLVEY